MGRESNSGLFIIQANVHAVEESIAKLEKELHEKRESLAEYKAAEKAMLDAGLKSDYYEKLGAPASGEE